MPHINDAKYAKLGGTGHISDLQDTFHGGPQDNDGWYAEFGGTEQWNDDAMTWLAASPQDAIGGHINDRFFDYWTTLLTAASGRYVITGQAAELTKT